MGYMRKDGLVERIPPFLIVIALPVLFFCGSAGFWTASGTDGRQDVRTGRLSLQAPCPLLGEGEDGIPACSFYLTQTPDLEARNTRHDGGFFLSPFNQTMAEFADLLPLSVSLTHSKLRCSALPV